MLKKNSKIKKKQTYEVQLKLKFYVKFNNFLNVFPNLLKSVLNYNPTNWGKNPQFGKKNVYGGNADKDNRLEKPSKRFAKKNIARL